MKYLFIFLPFFAFGQDTIVRGSDTMIIGRSYYNDPQFYKGWARAGKYTPLTDSTLYGVRIDTAYVAKHSSGFSDYLNGNIKLQNGPLYRYSTPKDTLIPVKPRMTEYADGRWKSCDQHIGKVEYPDREKMDKSEVNLLVWNGCSLIEINATKVLHYNETQVAKNTGGLAVYITETIKVDVVTQYAYEDKWIKPSHVIKEL